MAATLIIDSRVREFLIGGWIAPNGARTRLGAILVGCWDGDTLRYAGKFGRGFGDAMLERLRNGLERRERARPPFGAGRLPSGARWAEPELVAQIAFTEWTREGMLRHPRCEGLRDDKPAR